MRIEQSQVALSSSRTAGVTDETSSTMEAWVGQGPQGRTAIPSRLEPAALVALSAGAVAAASRQAAL